MKDGTKIRLKGKGEPGLRGGPPGDLYVIAQVGESPVFERRGSDLVVDVPVTMTEAALGATVRVPTPEGSVGLKVPAGTQTGKMLKLKGKGAPRLGASGKGDLLARIKVVTPEKLSGEQKDLLKKFAEVARRRPAGRPRRLVGLAGEMVYHGCTFPDERVRDALRRRDASGLHDLGSRRAGRHASADPADVRAAWPHPAAAFSEEHPALLAGRRASDCAGSSNWWRNAASISPGSSGCSRWKSN